MSLIHKKGASERPNQTYSDPDLRDQEIEKEIKLRLLSYVTKFIDLTEEEKEYFTSILKYKFFRKRQYLLQAGDVCNYESYVIKGCLRAYLADREGNEYILQFAVEDWWISDFSSFVTGSPAQLNIDALEDTQVLQISKKDQDALYEKVPKFNKMFRIMFQNAYITHQQRILNNLYMPAKERYLAFIKKYKNIEQRVSQVQIASYLGITPVFLSQIRKQIAKD